MPRTSNYLVNAAACARKARAEKNAVNDNDVQQPLTASDISNADTSSELVHGVDIGSDPPSDSEICSWNGGLNHYPSDVEKTTHWDSDSESEEDGFSDLEGDELLESLQKVQEKDLKRLENVSKLTAFDKMSQNLTSEEWKKAESNRHLGYSKGSTRTQRRHDLEARRKEEKDSVIRKT
jgi:hypothetical protein